MTPFASAQSAGRAAPLSLRGETVTYRPGPDEDLVTLSAIIYETPEAEQQAPGIWARAEAMYADLPGDPGDASTLTVRDVEYRIRSFRKSSYGSISMELRERR